MAKKHNHHHHHHHHHHSKQKKTEDFRHHGRADKTSLRLHHQSMAPAWHMLTHIEVVDPLNVLPWNTVQLKMYWKKMCWKSLSKSWVYIHSLKKLTASPLKKGRAKIAPILETQLIFQPSIFSFKILDPFRYLVPHIPCQCHRARGTLVHHIQRPPVSEGFFASDVCWLGEKKGFYNEHVWKNWEKTGLSCFVCWWFQISVVYFAHVTVRHGVSNSRSSMSFETTWFNDSRVLAWNRAGFHWDVFGGYLKVKVPKNHKK